ncbi:hypothetical protein [Dictyobacter aurantiacus]|nr:hypothetical protein [Dictyobacter aurantiacus]
MITRPRIAFTDVGMMGQLSHHADYTRAQLHHREDAAEQRDV